MTSSALFLSPHLDDVAFSCGGTLIRLASEGWRITMCTVFTASVQNPAGFALTCQLDKGLPANADYMAIRRDEDRRFAHVAKVRECIHLGFLEAPHRGYSSAPDLFAGIHADDTIGAPIARELAALAQPFDCIFAPQGLGNHVDHLQTILAVNAAGLGDDAFWYRDTPYAIRNAHASPAPALPAGLTEESFAMDVDLKATACAEYTTQVPFQFGSEELMREKLERFHCVSSGYSESFLRSTEAKTSPLPSRTKNKRITKILAGEMIEVE